MAPPLVPRYGVDLVDDHRAHGPQHFPRALGRQDEVERLGGGNQDVRRPAHHLLPLRARRIAGTNQGPDLYIRQARSLERPADLRERLGQVLLDVVREGLER